MTGKLIVRSTTNALNLKGDNMNIDKSLGHEINALLDSVIAGETDRVSFVSDCREIAKSYGIGYGYVLRRVRACQATRGHIESLRS